jgi:hypothetical protein
MCWWILLILSRNPWFQRNSDILQKFERTLIKHWF